MRAEHVRVGKRTRATGKVRVTKTVRERTAVIDEPLAADIIAVARVPMDRFVEGPIPDRYEGDTLVISVLEEVTVVEKRLRLKEELRITKRRVPRWEQRSPGTWDRFQDRVRYAWDTTRRRRHRAA